MCPLRCPKSSAGKLPREALSEGGFGSSAGCCPANSCQPIFGRPYQGKLAGTLPGAPSGESSGGTLNCHRAARASSQSLGASLCIQRRCRSSIFGVSFVPWTTRPSSLAALAAGMRDAVWGGEGMSLGGAAGCELRCRIAFLLSQGRSATRRAPWPGAPATYAGSSAMPARCVPRLTHPDARIQHAEPSKQQSWGGQRKRQQIKNQKHRNKVLNKFGKSI